MNKEQEVKLRMAFAHSLGKAIRQFEADGCPTAFEMKSHIDMLIKRTKEILGL